MRDRIGIFALVITAALVLGGAAFATRASGPAPSITTAHDLTVIATHAKFTNADIGGDGESIGDELVFTAVDKNADLSQVIGRLDGHCVFTQPTEEQGAWWEQCFLTHSLDDGQITLQGTFDQSSGQNRFAVTGGTGIYSNARGWVNLRFAKQFRFVFHLVP